MHYEHHLVDSSNNLTIGRQESEPWYWHYSVVSIILKAPWVLSSSRTLIRVSTATKPCNILYIIIMWMSGQVFCGLDVLPATQTNVQSQSNEGNHWPQPVAWRHLFFIHVRSVEGKGFIVITRDLQCQFQHPHCQYQAVQCQLQNDEWLCSFLYHVPT